MTQPTHDEVIAWIDKEIAIQRQYLDSSFYLDKKPHEIQLSVWLATRDVLEMCEEKDWSHKFPYMDGAISSHVTIGNNELAKAIRQAITNRLDEVM